MPLWWNLDDESDFLNGAFPAMFYGWRGLQREVKIDAFWFWNSACRVVHWNQVAGGLFMFVLFPFFRRGGDKTGDAGAGASQGFEFRGGFGRGKPAAAE